MPTTADDDAVEQVIIANQTGARSDLADAGLTIRSRIWVLGATIDITLDNEVQINTGLDQDRRQEAARLAGVDC